MEDWLIDFKDIKFRKFIMTADEIQELFYEKFADTPIFTRIEYICERFIDEYKTLGNKLEDEDEKETWDIEAAQAVAHDLRLADGLEIDPELIYDFISELIGLDADE